MKRKNGFTLAELLFVVAIIAVLVAIAIPVFTRQLERARETTDLANIRAAYAALLDGVIAGSETSPSYQADGSYAVTVPLKQMVGDWTLDTEGLELGGVPSEDWSGKPAAGGTCTVACYPETGIVTVSFDGSSGGGGGGSGSGGGITVTTSTPLTDEMKSSATVVNDIAYSGGSPRYYTGSSTHLDSYGNSPVAGVVYTRNGFYYQVAADTQLGGVAWFRWDESQQAWEKRYF